MSRIGSLALLSLVVGAAACHHGPRVAAPLGASATVIFTNESLDQADVYALPRGGGRVRIGTVLPGRTDTLTLDGSALGGSGSVTILARLLARSYAPNTGPVTLTGGERIAVRLSSDARSLSVLPAR